jgi:ribonucleoside-triphosphate reductase
MKMDLSKEILSEVVTHMKYAKYLPEKLRRETWKELVVRNMEMHQKKYPQLSGEIKDVYEDYVLTKKILPSMRSLQFAGKPIELNQSRIFNCSFLHIDDPDAFSEIMFLLLGGVGVGYSVQGRHTQDLPKVQGPKNRNRKFIISDSIEGWSDAVKVLVESYFYNKSNPKFVYDDIRPKGARLVTSGGKAPGPQPLKDCIYHLTSILDQATGRQLKSLEVHDMICHIADAVLAGGIRRAALISLFDKDDEEMLTCKSGDWWETHGFRGRANNSAVFVRSKTTKEEFERVWKATEASMAGEPGIFWTDDEDIGTNPCCEISLHTAQMCNLVEINSSDVETQLELNNRARAAAFIGTLQAGYTDFHYLREKWRKQTEKEALLGISMTGIASGGTLLLNLEEAANTVNAENERVADIIGINKSARSCTVKPAGSTSLVFGVSSGIHAWHNDYYIRRVRVGKNEAIYKYISEKCPSLVVDDLEKPHLQSIFEFPQKAPEGAILRSEPIMDTLERIKKFNTEWIGTGHRTGLNKHNVSATLNIKNGEWDTVGEWMWENRSTYAGLSALPYFGGSYVQAPFEDIDEERYNEMYKHLKSIDVSEILEYDDDTNLAGELACAAGSCEVK